MLTFFQVYDALFISNICHQYAERSFYMSNIPTLFIMFLNAVKLITNSIYQTKAVLMASYLDVICLWFKCLQ
jgi:hypothetical protein